MSKEMRIHQKHTVWGMIDLLAKVIIVGTTLATVMYFKGKGG